MGVRVKDMTPLASLGRGSYVMIDNGDETENFKFDLGTALQREAELPDLYDSASGRYVGIGQWMQSQRNGKIYGVRIPKYSASQGTACTKVGANAGLTITPATATDPGSDGYKDEFPFMGWDANGGADTDGKPYVTALRLYDTAFSLTGSNGEVVRMAPVLYWRWREFSEYWLLEICDTWLEGFAPQPGAKLPDGSLREFMLYAKYAGCKGSDGYMHSWSGRPLWNREVSHNSLVTQCRTASTGYSGKSIADDWYIKTMFLLKYATKNSQSVFTGCTGYTTQAYVTVAEVATSRVIISKTDAAGLLVGSTMMLGTRAGGSSDRNRADMHDVFDALVIRAIEEYDTNNAAVYFDTTATWDTATTYMLSTAPWHSGCLDSVQGTDGTITAAGRTNSKEPFLLQGIECMLGAYEVVGDVMLYSGTDGVEVYVNYDSKNEKSSYDSTVYTDTGKALVVQASGGWVYGTDVMNAGGLLVQAGSGADSSHGMCDGHYQSGSASNGWRELLLGGALLNVGAAGLWCDASSNGLSSADWIIASRLSLTGRTAA